MKIKQYFSLRRLGVLMAISVALAACGGSHHHDVNASHGDSKMVPSNISASSSAFVAYIQKLPQGDETSEPLTFDSSFTAPPADETDDSTAAQ